MIFWWNRIKFLNKINDYGDNYSMQEFRIILIDASNIRKLIFYPEMDNISLQQQELK